MNNIYDDKNDFVEYDLKPLLRNCEIGVDDVQYLKDTYWERVDITMSDGYVLKVNVSGDNNIAILRDVMRALDYFEQYGEYEQ